jgi:signal transduction histidine kinase
MAPPQLKLSLERIDAAVDRLSRLANDLLEVRRPSRKLALNRQPTDLVELVRGAAADRHALPDAAAPLLLDLPSEPVIVPVDRQRLEQVLSNLLDNATKYSPRGSAVEVTLARESNGARLMVRDRGIGLPPDEADAIFEPFTRAANAQDFPGLGLGLAICRQIVQQHGGRMWAQSPGQGQGTSVYVWLPVGQSIGADGRAGSARDGPASGDRFAGAPGGQAHRLTTAHPAAEDTADQSDQ